RNRKSASSSNATAISALIVSTPARARRSSTVPLRYVIHGGTRQPESRRAQERGPDLAAGHRDLADGGIAYHRCRRPERAATVVGIDPWRHCSESYGARSHRSVAEKPSARREHPAFAGFGGGTQGNRFDVRRWTGPGCDPESARHSG